MAAVVAERTQLREESVKLCSRCGERPRRLGGRRTTWCNPCQNEYERAYRAGVRRQRRVHPPVRDDSGCLLWQGYVAPNGYGKVRRNGVGHYAHRLAWQDAHGAIPDELTVDHLCAVKLCVEVSHMELVTRGENARRGNRQPPSPNCAQGHPFDRVTPRGRRYCSVCMAASNLRRRELSLQS